MWRGIMTTGAAAMLSGCVSAPVRLQGRPSGTMSLPLQGVYKATVRAPFIGPMSGRLTAEPDEAGFVANSRPGVAWEMIGGVQGLLGQVFAPYLFPGGAIVTWRSDSPADGKPGEGWLGVGGIRTVGVKTRMSDPNEPIELITPDGRRAALMTLEPCPPGDAPLADYKGLAARIGEVFRDRLYDRELVRSSQVRAFLSQVRFSAARARDDVEFVFGEAIAARNNLRFSMPIAVRRADEESRRLERETPGLATIHATLDQISRIATVKVDAFLEPEDVDRAMAKVAEWEPRGVLLDLRSCPGVRLSSLRLACWLMDRPVDAGFFFGPERRAEALEGKVDGFARAELQSAASVGELEALLDAAGAAAVVVRPEAKVYGGPVAVLISRRTTTSAEPLAWLLKSTGRARLFGSTTVGRPMISRPTDIGQGWDFWLAAFDFKPAVGEQFNDRGIEPDVETAGRESARRAAMRWLISRGGGESDAAGSGLD